MLQRRNDKIVPRLGISFDAKTLVTYNCNVMNPFHEKKDVAKKKELIHIGIAPLSIKVSESRKSKSGLEKKPCCCSCQQLLSQIGGESLLQQSTNCTLMVSVST